MAVLALAVCAGPVWATQVGFLVDHATKGKVGEVEYETAKFSIYLDPLKTNWISWSQLAATPKIEGKSKIDGDAERSGLLDGSLLITVIDPWGRRGPALTFDDNDETGNPVGQQAILYGVEQMTPEVVRFNREGERFSLIEQGLIDDFVNEGGEGYYTFQITYVPTEPKAGRPDLYLLMDVVEGYRQKPPIVHDQRHGALAVPLDYLGHLGSDGFNSLYGPDDFFDDDDDNDNDPNDPFFPPPPGGDDDDDDDDDPNPPVIPEPATVIMVGIGLAGAGMIQRRRRRA